MKNNRLEQIEKRILKIKSDLQHIDKMRPGSLTKQFKDPKAETGAYYQLSYTHKMKSRTDYVRSDSVKAVKRQVAEYKKFKYLIDSWIELAIEYSKAELKSAKKR